MTYHAWLQNALNGIEPVALFEPVLSAVLRIATHPAIFKPPSPRDAVEAFIDTCLAAPAAKAVRAEAAHWELRGEGLQDGLSLDEMGAIYDRMYHSMHVAK